MLGLSRSMMEKLVKEFFVSSCVVDCAYLDQVIIIGKVSMCFLLTLWLVLIAKSSNAAEYDYRCKEDMQSNGSGCT